MIFETDYTSFSNDKLADIVTQMSPEKLQVEIAKMGPTQVNVAVHTLSKEQDEQWQEKLRAIYLGLHLSDTLEAAGKALTPFHTLEVLEISADEDPKHQWKLAPLLVGVSHRVFQHVLQNATTKHLYALQQEGLSEALQHHLTLLAHEFKYLEDHIANEIQLATSAIEKIDLAAISRKEMDTIFYRLSDAKEICSKAAVTLNHALALAWNTNRPDLIAKFSVFKDHFFKMENYEIGCPRSFDNPSRGLYAKLEERLSAIYGSSSQQDQIEALQDDEPAIEALTKLSLWYFKDYWEVGLLPGLPESESSMIDTSNYAEKSHQEKRERLLNQIHTNLRKLGLSTVADIKTAGIYSKGMLKEYIVSNAHRLQNAD